MDAQVVLFFYFFHNMQRIKINLCAEVAAFFSYHGKKLSCAINNYMAMRASGKFAAGFLFIFYFWLCNGKNYRMYFSSQKELENL